MLCKLNLRASAGAAGAALLLVIAGCRTADPVYTDSAPTTPPLSGHTVAELDPEEAGEPSPPPPPAEAADNLGPNILAWDAVFKEYRARPGETNAPFSFNLTNISAEPLMIFATESGCDCTVARLPASPWSIAPGSSGRIQADVDLRKKIGASTNYVIVFTSKGNRMLTLKTVTPRATASASHPPAHP